MSSAGHILCVIEHPDERRRLSQTLLTAFPAARVQSASNAVEFFHAVEQSAFDVAITDGAFDGLDSLSILGVVKKRTPTCAVVLFPTLGSEEMAVRALKSGFDDYIGNGPHRYHALTSIVDTLFLQTRQLPPWAREAEPHHSLWDTTGDAIVTFSWDGVIAHVNRSAELALGWPRKELIGCQVKKVLTPSSLAEAEAQHRAFLTGEKSLPLSFDAELLRSDGHTTPVEARTWVFCSPEGKPLGVRGLFRPRAEHERMGDLWQEEVEINTALARVAQELIVSLDATTILDRLCRVATEVLGCDCSHTCLWDPEANGYRIIAGNGDTSEQWELIRAIKIPREAGRELGGHLFRAGDLVELASEDTNPPFPGAVMREIGITASLVIALQRGEDVFGALLVSYRRRQKFSEQQKRLARGLAQLASLALANARLQSEVERANRLKEDFVGTMSHELRTPLNIILGYSQLLCEHTFGDLNAEQVKVLDRVQTSALELLRLIDTTLDFSRLQSQRVPLEICDVHVPTLLQETADGPHQVPPKPEIQVQWRVAPDVPLLQTDAGKLKIILKNLVTNALKFTEQGSVSINAAPYDQGVIFTVTDTGPGIAQEEMALIFEPFRQGGAFATRRQGGVGLGLHIAQELVHLLGGTISVQSELGRGSTFAAWLPGKKP